MIKLVLRKRVRQPALKKRAYFQAVLQWAADNLLTSLVEQRGLHNAALHVVVIDRRHMAELNRDFAGHTGPTDVLAFDFNPAPGGPEDANELPVLAEIYVCADVATSAAGEYNTTQAYEMVLYAVHGMLHIRGYNDHTENERKEMRQHEQVVMAEIENRFDLTELFV